MQGQHYALPDGAAQQERAAVEQRVRQSLAEIRQAIEALEQTCRDGRYTLDDPTQDNTRLRYD